MRITDHRDLFATQADITAAPIGGPVLNETFPGTGADDNYVGTGGNDVAKGGRGDDALNGLGGDDLLNGGADADILNGGDGQDTLVGGSGDDYLRGGLGADSLNGGDGFDRVGFSDSTVGVTVSLLLQGMVQDTGAGADTLVGIEDLSGTAYADKLTGDDQANWLWGGPVNSPDAGSPADTLVGNGGNDLLEVGSGSHILTGNAGIDTVSFFANQTFIGAAVTVDLSLQGAAQDTGQGMMRLTGIEQLSGTIYNDTLVGDGGANLLAGDNGADTLQGGGGADLLFGDGGVGVYGASGTAGAISTLQQIDPQSADAPAGADLLQGGAANDTLIGGYGADTLVGGAGKDLFTFLDVRDSLPDAPDLVSDFGSKDRVSLLSIDADSSTRADDPFHFVEAFTGHAAEAVLSYDRRAGVTHLLLDTDGDATADAVIDFTGRVAASGQFVL